MISVDYVSLRVTRKKIDRSTVPFKVRIIPVLAVLMVIWLSAAFQIEASIRPSDIEGCWAEEAILALVNEGIITGYPDGTFKPEDPVTRAEFSKMIAKAFAIRTAGEPVFSDIEGNWAEA